MDVLANSGVMGHTFIFTKVEEQKIDVINCHRTERYEGKSLSNGRGSLFSFFSFFLKGIYCDFCKSWSMSL